MRPKDVRRTGYYWVKYCGNWVVAAWNLYGCRHWKLIGDANERLDSHFDEIEEIIIQRGIDHEKYG